MAHWVITGANRGIGFEMARQVLAAGGQVSAIVRDLGRAKELAALDAQAPGRLAILRCDVANADDVADLGAAIRHPVDVLVNNAGIHGPRDPQTATGMDFEAFAEVLAVNTTGPLRVTQALLPRIAEAVGKIATISSVMGSFSGAGASSLAYRTSKAAVNKAMQGLAEALRPQALPVLIFHPGWVRTDMGGQNAPVSVAESAAGLIRLIEASGPAETGSFRDYAGKTIPW